MECRDSPSFSLAVETFGIDILWQFILITADKFSIIESLNRLPQL